MEVLYSLVVMFYFQNSSETVAAKHDLTQTECFEMAGKLTELAAEYRHMDRPKNQHTIFGFHGGSGQKKIYRSKMRPASKHFCVPSSVEKGWF